MKRTKSIQFNFFFALYEQKRHKKATKSKNLRQSRANGATTTVNEAANNNKNSLPLAAGAVERERVGKVYRQRQWVRGGEGVRSWSQQIRANPALRLLTQPTYQKPH